jgi:hypothetical protein
VKNAICIHEEDAGILFKHTDFRDESTIVTRGRKLIISQIFTAANYEYCIYWTFLQDGTVQLEIKLTGILNTTAMNPGEDLEGYGTEVYTGVNAHNHQHLFCLRVDPNIDGQENTIFQSDAVRSPYPVGHEKNKWGNGFTVAKTKFTNVTEAQSDYDGATSRTWDIANENKLNKHSKKPVSYKLVSRESAPLMPKEGSLVWKRAGFARHTVHVTKCKPNRSLSYLFIALTHTQTRMISCTPLAAMLSRLQANHQLVSLPGLPRTRTRTSRTRTSCCGTALALLTLPRPKISPSCLLSPSLCCFDQETFSRGIHAWMVSADCPRSDMF